MLIFDRVNWRHHWPWCLATAVVSLAAAGWYVIQGSDSGRWTWPSGGSPPGFSYGALGGLIISFEMLLWPRKYLWRRRQLGRTKLWMTAHIWLGLLALPLLLLHGGFHFHLATSTLAAVLMWLLVIVVGSGIFGLVIQNIVPRLMLAGLPAETIHAEIRHVLAQYRDEADRLVAATCGRTTSGGAGEADQPRSTGRVGDPPTFVPLETLRREGQVRGKVVEARFEPGSVPGSEPLLAFFRSQVEPYLTAGSGAKLPLGSRGQAASLFLALKIDLPLEAHPIVDRLAELCDRRRQFDLQARLHGWLNTWLGVHLALSTALFLLMFVHIYFALSYGWPAWL
jgi:hypothetical protein